MTGQLGTNMVPLSTWRGDSSFTVLTVAGHEQLAIEREQFDRLMFAIHKVWNAV
jgi:hypothetical protein